MWVCLDSKNGTVLESLAFAAAARFFLIGVVLGNSHHTRLVDRQNINPSIQLQDLGINVAWYGRLHFLAGSSDWYRKFSVIDNEVT